MKHKAAIEFQLEVANTIKNWGKKGATNFVACLKKDGKDKLCANIFFSFKGKLKYAGYRMANTEETIGLYDLMEKEVEQYYKTK